MQTRRFQESDRATCRLVYKHARTSTFTWFDSKEFGEEDFDRDTAGELIWVATDGDDLLGFISVWEKDNFIHNLFVHPARLGQGVGTTLLTLALEHIGRPARLKCDAGNVRARKFYLSRGWTIAERAIGPHGEYFLMQLIEEA